jgi:DNA polymerase III gamma/tau subunit
MSLALERFPVTALSQCLLEWERSLNNSQSPTASEELALIHALASRCESSSRATSPEQTNNAQQLTQLRASPHDVKLWLLESQERGDTHTQSSSAGPSQQQSQEYTDSADGAHALREIQAQVAERDLERELPALAELVRRMAHSAAPDTAVVDALMAHITRCTDVSCPR